MDSLDMSAYVRLPFATVVAVWTLESRLLAALVPQMPLQRAFPDEHARAIRAREFLVRVVES